MIGWSSGYQTRPAKSFVITNIIQTVKIGYGLAFTKPAYWRHTATLNLTLSQTIVVWQHQAIIEPILSYNKWGSVTRTSALLHRKCSRILSVAKMRKLHFYKFRCDFIKFLQCYEKDILYILTAWARWNISPWLSLGFPLLLLLLCCTVLFGAGNNKILLKHLHTSIIDLIDLDYIYTMSQLSITSGTKSPSWYMLSFQLLSSIFLNELYLELDQ